MSRIQPPTITSPHNPTIKLACRLHQAEERARQSKFLVEGPHLIQEALQAHWPVETIFYEAGNDELWRTVLDLASSSGRILLQPVSREVLRKLSTTDSMCPILGIALNQVAPTPKPSPVDLAIAAESLQDPGNLGSLIRIAAAADLGPVVLGRSSVDPTNPKVLRSSAGLWFRNPPLFVDLEGWVAFQKQHGVQILAAAADGESLWRIDLTHPTVFLLGNEGAGLSDAVRNLATKSIAIPMNSKVESLNVSVSGALLAYEAKRQRLQKGHGIQS
jgi:TrmH family RNA methyltransferase